MTQWTPTYRIRSASKATGPGTWNIQDVEILGPGDVVVGKYTYNYSMKPPFFAFERDGQWYALYAKDYTASRIMKLPSCEDVWGEGGDTFGFAQSVLECIEEVDPVRQLGFARLHERGAKARIPALSSDSHSQEMDVQSMALFPDFDEPVPESALSERDKQVRRRLAEVTPADFEKTLRRVATYNPHAAELIKKADASTKKQEGVP